MEKYLVAVLLISGAWLANTAGAGGVRPYYPAEAAAVGIDGIVTGEYWVTPECELESKVVESEPPGVFEEAYTINLRRFFIHDQEDIDWESIPGAKRNPDEVISIEEYERLTNLVLERGPWPVIRDILISGTDEGYLRCFFKADGDLMAVEYRERGVTKWTLEQAEIARTKALVDPRPITFEYSFED